MAGNLNLSYLRSGKNNLAYVKIFKSMIYENLWVWSLFHICLGLLSTISSYFIIIWFYLLLSTFLIAPNKIKLQTLPMVLGYLLPIEMLGRLTKADPFIPHEVGKYLGIFLLLYGITINPSFKKGDAGKWILFFSIPSVFIGYFYSDISVRDIVRDYFGIFTLSLSIIFFANLSLTRIEIIRIFKVIYLPCLSILMFVFIKSPDLTEAEYILSSNSAFSGGLGPNQVSTILGMAFGILLWLWIIKYDLYPIKLLNLIIPGIFLVWALLSFSRGGVISAILGLLLTVIFVPGNNKHRFTPRKINISLVLAFIMIIGGGFWYINEISDNQLLLRYQGETTGTLIGVKERGISQLSSGRWDVFKTDIAMWMDNIIFGVGVGRSYEIRGDYGIPKVSAHVEISRLISEHGIFGFIISLIFLFLPITLFFNARGNHFRQAFIIFCMTLAIATTFHAAMRTLLTPFFYGLAFAYIPKPKEESIIYKNTI